MAITCCNGCVPPKRNPHCHSTCPEYKEQKAKHDEEKAEYFKKSEVDAGLVAQTMKGVHRAYKARKKKKG